MSEKRPALPPSASSDLRSITGSLLLISNLLLLPAPSALGLDLASPSDCPSHFQYSALWRAQDAWIEDLPATTEPEFDQHRHDLALRNMQLFDIETALKIQVSSTTTSHTRHFAGLWRQVDPMDGDLDHLLHAAAPPMAPWNTPPSVYSPGSITTGTSAGSDGGFADGSSGDDASGSYLPDFETLVLQERRLGFELVDFELDDHRSEIWGLFHPRVPPHELELDISFDDAQDRITAQAALGWIPVDVEVYRHSGTDLLAILWRFDPGKHVVLAWGEEYEAFATVAPLLWHAGYRPLDLEQFHREAKHPGDPQNGYATFVGLWEPAEDDDYYLSKGKWSQVVDQDAAILGEYLDSAPSGPVRQLWDIDMRWSLMPGCGNNPQPLEHDGSTSTIADADP